MEPAQFEFLVDQLSTIYSSLDDVEEWIPCTDCDVLRDLPTMAERRRWFRKARTEHTRRRIQERVDEITEAWECEDEILVSVLLEAFPKDLLLHKRLKPSQRQMWIDRAMLAACGRAGDPAPGEPIIYFISADDGLVKIGHTANLRSRLRSLRTASPKELRVLLAISGSRDDEQELHRRFAEFRVSREWFRRSEPIEAFIASRVSAASDEATWLDKG